MIQLDLALSGGGCWWILTKEVIFHSKAQTVILFSSGPRLLLYTRQGCDEDDSRFGQERELLCLDLYFVFAKDE